MLSLVFLDIAYNDSLQQCLTFSGGKTHEKIGAQILVSRAKIGLKLDFLQFSQVWLFSFP